MVKPLTKIEPQVGSEAEVRMDQREPDDREIGRKFMPEYAGYQPLIDGGPPGCRWIASGVAVGRLTAAPISSTRLTRRRLNCNAMSGPLNCANRSASLGQTMPRHAAMASTAVIDPRVTYACQVREDLQLQTILLATRRWAGTRVNFRSFGRARANEDHDEFPDGRSWLLDVTDTMIDLDRAFDAAVPQLKADALREVLQGEGRK